MDVPARKEGNTNSYDCVFIIPRRRVRFIHPHSISQYSIIQKTFRSRKLSPWIRYKFDNSGDKDNVKNSNCHVIVFGEVIVFSFPCGIRRQRNSASLVIAFGNSSEHFSLLSRRNYRQKSLVVLHETSASAFIVRFPENGVPIRSRLGASR